MNHLKVANESILWSKWPFSCRVFCYSKLEHDIDGEICAPRKPEITKNKSEFLDKYNEKDPVLYTASFIGPIWEQEFYFLGRLSSQANKGKFLQLSWSMLLLNILFSCFHGFLKIISYIVLSALKSCLTPSIRDRVHRNEHFMEINPV